MIVYLRTQLLPFWTSAKNYAVYWNAKKREDVIKEEKTNTKKEYDAACLVYCTKHLLFRLEKKYQNKKWYHLVVPKQKIWALSQWHNVFQVTMQNIEKQYNKWDNNNIAFTSAAWFSSISHLKGGRTVGWDWGDDIAHLKSSHLN